MEFKLFPRRGRVLAVTLSVLGLTFLTAIGPEAARGQIAGAAVDSSYIESADTMELTGLQKDFVAIARRVAPEVVSISAACDPSNSDAAMRADDLTPQRLNDILSRTTRTIGTGFFIDPHGYILTNEHVVSDAEQLWVTTDDRKVYPAIVIGSDPRADLAVLKIPRDHVPVVKFAADKALARGDWTIAMGNPYGLASGGDLAMSVGVISALDRSLPKLSSKEGRLYSNLIQTTAEINPGNSGGPLFDLQGQVIGISSAVILPERFTNGIGFAIPVNEALLHEIAELKQGHEIVYSYVGVTVGDPSPRELHDAGLDNRGAARVDAIDPKSPASKTGIRVGDLVVSVDGVEVRDTDQFVRLAGRMRVGAAGKLGVWRDRKLKQIKVIPCRRDLPMVAVSKWTQRLRWHGMTLGPVPANWGGSSAKKAVGGVYVVGIDDPLICSKLGIKQGSIIHAIDGQVVTSIEDLQKIINATPPDQLKIETAAEAQTVAAVEESK